MNCIYLPELTEKSREFSIGKPQSDHCKAYRLKVGDSILFSNGRGLLSACILSEISNKNYSFRLGSVLKNEAMPIRRLGLALGIIDIRDRFEFALEKAVELGVTDFYPLITQHCQKTKVNTERLISKSIAALEQSQRNFLPLIHKPLKLHSMIDSFPEWQTILLADENGGVYQPNNDIKNILVMVGPEGGFTSDEIEKISHHDNCSKISLGTQRLRAETAAIAMMSLVTAL